MSFNMDDYVDVAERIRLAKETYPDMRLQPANPAVPYVIEEIAVGVSSAVGAFVSVAFEYGCA